MKILFAMSTPGTFRFYDDTIALLAERGHQVAVAVNTVNKGKPVRFDALSGANVTVIGVMPARDDGWVELARAIRGTMDFVRYLHPSLSRADALRARMKRQALPTALQWLDWIPALPPRALALAMNALGALERAIPPASSLLRWLDQQDPDLVVVSPLVEAASDQVDLVKAAQARGIRTAVAVASWDNLTNKGDLRVRPDALLLWNEAQALEAVELHRIPRETIVPTGAQVFDRWFGRAPARARDAFCREVGLPPHKPFVLYVGSSIFISRADAEMPFVRAWIDALRSSDDPKVRDLGVLVRPHPYNGNAWRPELFDGMQDVAVWPRGGYNPIEAQSRTDFFDSIFHSSAVVGINTSAMIEAAIVGRPVLSIVLPELQRSQEGTLHFRHMLPENGGFLRVASTLDAHASQLASILGDPEMVAGEIARFVASFVRPHGIDRPAVPILVEAIERTGASRVAREEGKASRSSLAMRLAVRPLTLAPAMALAAPARRKSLRRPRP